MTNKKKIKLVKSVRNESYYANLSALFLNISLCLGLGGVVAASIIKICYSPINESLSTIYIIVSLIFFVVSILLFERCYKKYHKYQVQNLKKTIDTSKTTNNRDIYVLGTFIMIIIELTTIYFVMTSLNNKTNEIRESRQMIKNQIVSSLNGQIKTKLSDDLSILLVNYESENATGSANININGNNASLCNSTSMVFSANLDRYDTNALISDFNSSVSAMFSAYPATFDIDTLTNGMSANVRSAIEGFKSGNGDSSYVYNRIFTLSFAKIKRTVTCLENNGNIIIDVKYTCQ